MSMRIVVVGNIRSIHVSRWIEFLAARGHDVHAFSDEMPEAPMAAVHVHGMRASSMPKLARGAAGVVQLRRLVHRLRPDAVHLQSVGLPALLATAVPDGLLVVSPWGSDVVAARRHPIRRAVVGHLLRRASLVLTTSRAMATEVTQDFGVQPPRVRVVSWGIDPEVRPIAPGERRQVRRMFGLPADAVVLVAIRSFAPTYRTAELVEAFSVAAPAGIHLVLLRGYTAHDRVAAARQMDYRRRTLERAGRLPAGSWTYVDRTLDPAQYRALVGASDVAVSIPVADQRSSSVLEALGMGLTVVGADLPAYRELVQDGFALRLVGDPIAATLARWLAQPYLLTPAEAEGNVALVEAGEDRFTQYARMEEAIASRG